jgi:hypothetical protein
LIALGHRLERHGFAADHRPHSSSANRFTAGASGFLLLTQSASDRIYIANPSASRRYLFD